MIPPPPFLFLLRTLNLISMHSIYLGLWRHLAPFPLGRRSMERNTYFQEFFKNNAVCDFFLLLLFFFKLRRQSWLSAAFQMWKCTAEPTQTSLHHGFNTYQRRSHMAAKNRSKSHSHHQPLLLSTLLSPIIPSFSQHIPHPEHESEMLLFVPASYFQRAICSHFHSYLHFPANWIETKLRITYWKVLTHKCVWTLPAAGAEIPT